MSTTWTGPSSLALAPDDLTRVVRRALGAGDVSVHATHIRPLHYDVRNAISAGLYRIEGTTDNSNDGEELAWSLILKIVQPKDDGQSDSPAHWNYWRREALAYQSGLLERLTQAPDRPFSCLTVPRCWEVQERPDGNLWLWMEDVAETGETHWTTARYGLAARHFGSFQGDFLAGRPLPPLPWLSRGWMRARVASFADAMRGLHDPAFWADPRVQDTCPRSLEARLARLWAEREQFLEALDRLPQTLCHLDVWRPNLMARAVPSDASSPAEQTVALDWSYIGLGAVGQDIGNLVPDSLGNFDIDIDEARALDQSVFDGYLQGLREAGWTGDARLPRLGYAASAALGWGLGTPWWLAWPQDRARQAQLEARWGRPLEDLLAQRATLTEFVLGLAEEARQLF